jgi:hypothetical protein
MSDRSDAGKAIADALIQGWIDALAMTPEELLARGRAFIADHLSKKEKTQAEKT